MSHELTTQLYKKEDEKGGKKWSYFSNTVVASILFYNIKTKAEAWYNQSVAIKNISTSYFSFTKMFLSIILYSTN